MPPEQSAGLPASRSGDPAAARDDRLVPDPRRHRAGPHAAVPRPAAARRRRRRWRHRRGGLHAGARPGRHHQHPARHRPGADARGWPGSTARSTRSSASSRPSSIRRPCFNPGKIVGPDPALPPGRCGMRAVDRCAGRARRRTARRHRTPTATRCAGRWPTCASRERPTATAAGTAAPRSRRQRHVPDLPRHPRRGRHAAGQGQPDAPPAPGRSRSAGLSSDEVRAVADLCVNCKMCALECPAHVNVPQLMLEAKAANVARHGLDRNDWFLARTETFARAGQRASPAGQPGPGQPRRALAAGEAVRHVAAAAPAALRAAQLPAPGRRARLDAETAPGPAARRLLRGCLRQLQRSADRRGGGRGAAPQRHRGLRAARPARLRHGALAHGDVETAREIAEHNLRLFAEAVRSTTSRNKDPVSGVIGVQTGPH